MDLAILIPAYEPDEKLILLIDQLTKLPFPQILVINDGSSEKCKDIFKEAEGYPKCTVIHHKFNKGKGAALKTGMKAVLELDNTPLGIITVDADGQHLPEDIVRVGEFLEKNPYSLVLGSRDFNLENVPMRSKLGNKITSAVFKFSTTKTVVDTQTGLRAIPVYAMREFINISGDRYEFEMNMLMEATKKDIPISEVTIQTVYIDENKSSHFNTLMDSYKIYKEILKFSFSSLS